MKSTNREYFTIREDVYSSSLFSHKKIICVEFFDILVVLEGQHKKYSHDSSALNIAGMIVHESAYWIMKNILRLSSLSVESLISR